MGQQLEFLAETIYEEEDELNFEEDKEFYEKIEAPKFVDLTLPDPYHPDDRFWFCSRVGCDQKHEEETDSEAIYKKFVLRVMAARSPNIKLRKALKAKIASTNAKCPLSAPAKSSKLRVAPRLAVVSSIPQKLVIDPKEKVRSKLTSTPIPTSKQVAAKYMTTPRNKKCILNQNPFRSVQNPKLNNVSSPKTRIIAMALVFQSPKKAMSVKTSVELQNFNVSSKKVNVSSKKVVSNVKKTLPLDCSKKKASDHRVKSVLRPQISKQLESKSSICMKSKGKLTQECNSSNKEVIEHESSDMEVDVKSRIFERLEKDEKKSSELKGEECSTQVMDGNDDKENALVPHDNRDMNCENVQERKILGKEIQEKNKKGGAQTIRMNFKAGSSEIKHRKPKPTNPKPFRLRTNERGILREANLEKKSYLVAPQREARTVSNSMKRHVNESKANDKCFKQSKTNNDVLQGSKKEAQTVLQKIEPKQTRASALKSLRGQMIQKTANITPQRKFRLYSKENTNQIVRPQGVGSSRKAQLSAIKENSSKFERSKEVIKPSNARKRRPVTVTAEPKFQKTHLPNSIISPC